MDIESIYEGLSDSDAEWLRGIVADRNAAVAWSESIEARLQLAVETFNDYRAGKYGQNPEAVANAFTALCGVGSQMKLLHRAVETLGLEIIPPQNTDDGESDPA